MAHFYARFPASRRTSRFVLGFNVIFDQWVFPPKYTRLPDCRTVVSCPLSVFVRLGPWTPPPPLLLVLPLFAAIEMFVRLSSGATHSRRSNAARVRTPRRRVLEAAAGLAARARYLWRRRYLPIGWHGGRGGAGPKVAAAGGGGSARLWERAAAAARTFRRGMCAPPLSRAQSVYAYRAVVSARLYTAAVRSFVSKRDLFIINFK